jgi:RHS repeat-associated protein
VLTIDYKYDAFGEEIEKDLNGSALVKFGIDGWNSNMPSPTGNENMNIWADLAGTGAMYTRQLSGNGVDQHLGRIEIGSPNLAYWTIQDRLNSVRDVINSGGTLKDSIAYDGFGSIKAGELNSSFRGWYAFTGRLLEVETSLQYNNARWYDPKMGRWISQDPLGFDAGDSNLYRYVNNRATSASDPSGLEGGIDEPRVLTNKDVTNGPEFKLKDNKIELPDKKYVVIRAFKGVVAKDFEMQSAIRIQAISNDKSVAKGIEFIQFVNREITFKDGTSPVFAVLVAKRKVGAEEEKTDYFNKVNTKEWNVDSARNSSAYYAPNGASTYGRYGGIKEWEKSMLDQPGIYKDERFQTQKRNFRTFVVYKGEIIYQVFWSQTATWNKDKKQWNDPVEDVDLAKSGKFKTSDFPVDQVFAETLPWAYHDKDFKKPITVKNPFAPK